LWYKISKIKQIEGGNLTLQQLSNEDRVMLYTNLKHLENAAEFRQVVIDYEHVVVICGRMGPMCIPVYRIAEELEKEYSHVKFFDMEFDNPESKVIQSIPEVMGFAGIPFTIYYRNGLVVKATSGIQSKEQIITILEHELAQTVSI